MSESKKVKDLTQKELDALLEARAELERKKETARNAWRRREAKRSILVQKANDAGITVEESEIDEYLKNRKKAK